MYILIYPLFTLFLTVSFFSENTIALYVTEILRDSYAYLILGEKATKKLRLLTISSVFSKNNGEGHVKEKVS